MNLISELLNKPIGYHAVLAKALKSVPAAVMLSQGLFWQRVASGKNQDWWWVTAEEWYNQTGLTDESQATARKVLRDSGVWHEKRQGLPAKLYYRIDLDGLSDFVKTFVDGVVSSFRESRKQDPGGNGDRLPGIPVSGSGESREQDTGNDGDKKSNTEIKEEIKEEIKSNPDADAAGATSHQKAGKASVKDTAKNDGLKAGAAATPWTKQVATIFDEVNERKHAQNNLDYMPFNWAVCSEENFKQLKNLRVNAIDPDFKTRWNRVASEEDILISFRAVFDFAWDYFYRIQKETGGALCFTPTNIYKSYNKIKSTKNGNSKSAPATKSPLGRGINENERFDPRSGY